MIRDDKELETTQQRILTLQRVLAQFRVKASPEEFPYVSSGYRAEVEHMQAEAAEYLSRHSTEPLPAKAV